MRHKCIYWCAIVYGCVLACKYVHACICMHCMYSLYTCMPVCRYAHVYIYTYILNYWMYECVFVCVYVCMYALLFVCMFIHVSIVSSSIVRWLRCVLPVPSNNSFRMHLLQVLGPVGLRGVSVPWRVELVSRREPGDAWPQTDHVQAQTLTNCPAWWTHAKVWITHRLHWCYRSWILMN